MSTLKLARRSGTTWTKTSIAPGVRYSSLAFDPSAIPPSRLRQTPTAIRLPTRCGSRACLWQLAGRDDRRRHQRRRGLGAPGIRPGERQSVDRGQPDGHRRGAILVQDGGGAWQVEQVGAGFRPALLVHNGVPIVSYVTPDGYGLVVATRGAWRWTSTTGRSRRALVTSANRASRCRTRPAARRQSRIASRSTASTRPGPSGWPVHRPTDQARVTAPVSHRRMAVFVDAELPHRS